MQGVKEGGEWVVVVMCVLNVLGKITQHSTVRS